MRLYWYSRTRWARRSRCGAIRPRRCASASASCATTTADTEAPRPARPLHPGGPRPGCAGSAGWPRGGALPSAASRSGMVGMWLASEAPERVERLALCCTAASFDPDAYSSRARTVREHGVAEVSDAVLERWFTPAARAIPGPRMGRADAARDPTGGLRGVLRGDLRCRPVGAARRHPRPHPDHRRGRGPRRAAGAV